MVRVVDSQWLEFITLESVLVKVTSQDTAVPGQRMGVGRPVWPPHPTRCGSILPQVTGR